MTVGASRNTLLIGYGNPARADDGLGPALAADVDKLGLGGVTVDIDYQLTVEHAEMLARHKVVVFVDAATEGPEPFSFERLQPAAEASFTTHSVQPAAVLGLAHALFGAQTAGYVLGIRGYQFNMFTESLSGKARDNLSAATRFIEDVLRSGRFGEAAGGAPIAEENRR